MCIGNGSPGPGPRRVLFLIWAGVLRGAERHVFDLVTSLPADQYRATVCFFSSADAYRSELENTDTAFVELGNRSTKFSARGVLRFLRIVRRGGFSLVHDHGAPLWARVAVRLAAPDVPLVYTEHITRFTRLRRWTYAIARRCTSAHIAVSLAARDALVEQLGVAKSSVTVVPNSVDPGRFPVLCREERDAVRRQIGVPADCVMLISVGRLTASKQFDRLTDALRPLLGGDAATHLVVVGEGEERDALAERVAMLGIGAYVHFLGPRRDIPQLLSAADLFVFASREESFGIAVAEAMLASQPVVALRIPGVEEVVADGQTGVLVSPANWDTDFARATKQLIADPALRAAMGRRGRARALSLFHPDVTLQGVMRVYDGLLTSARRSAR